MGAWSVSITGNDTAEDLKSEYQAAFFYYDIETALSKIDKYVRAVGFDESDEEEWCNYYYSLADFMWRKGILTDSIRDKAVQMIDSEFGLELWAESGEKVLSKRKKVLADFKAKLLSPQGAKKKIRVDLHLTPVFEVGDIVAFQLKTNDKTYLRDNSKFEEDFFKQADGKYVVVRKIEDHISYRSSIVPEVADHWIVFQLYSKIFEELPDVSALNNIGWANTGDAMGTFVCESSLFYFKKRNSQVIGNNTNEIEIAVEEYHGNNHIFFGINMAHYNADTLLINAII